MDPSSQFIVPTIIDVPELIVTNEDIDFDEASGRHLTGDMWLSRLHFLSSAMSYCIGLGNLIRFPHLCYKYAGGAFLVAYTLVLLAIGLPLFLMELAFGQYANESPITIWRISPAFEGIGYTMCLICAMVAIYYNMLNTWIVYYLFASLNFGTLPWASCDNRWNLASCIFKSDHPISILQNCTQINQNNGNISSPTSPNSSNSTLPPMIFDENSTSSAIISAQTNCSSFDRIINTTYDVTLPANEYFREHVVSMSKSLNDLGVLNVNILFGLMVTWLMVFWVLLSNSRPSGRWALVGFMMPYMMLVALLIRALSLEGSIDGLAYYFSVDWTHFQDIDIWADATTQILFALSPCWGTIITLASMNKFHNNFHSNTMQIVSLNFMTSLLSGLVAFATLGYMANYSGIAFKELVDVGIGFAFMVYPEILAKMPLANLNSIIFFSSLLYVGITSQLTVIETVVTTIVDTWPHKLRYRKPLVLMILCGSMFIFSLLMCFGNGFYLVQLVDQFAGTYTGMTVGILESIAVAWVYGMENFMQDIDDMISVHRNLFPSRTYWYFLWRYLTPSLLFAILIFCVTDHLPMTKYRDAETPGWSIKLGWTMTIVCLAAIPAMAIVRFLLSPSGSFLDKINYLCRPSEDWAPSSYVSGPKLINRHHMMMEESNMLESTSTLYSSQRQPYGYTDQDQESNDEDESNEDLKVVDGLANYIIPEEEDDTDTGLITNETNV